MCSARARTQAVINKDNTGYQLISYSAIETVIDADFPQHMSEAAWTQLQQGWCVGFL
jgi:hypothetical protein